MSREQLIARLYQVAIASLSSANQHNPFISKSDAMKDINLSRKLIYDQYYELAATETGDVITSCW